MPNLFKIKPSEIFHNMSQLSKLYQTMANLKELGLKINEDLIDEVNKLEEEIIKKEILPVLTEKIAPALSSVERELVLVVDYRPNQPLSVRLTRKLNFAAEIPDAKIIKLDPEVEHSKRGQSSAPISRVNITRFSVEFPDGTIIAKPKATDTFVTAVKKIGVAKVRSIVEREHLVFCRVPVISNRRDSKYGKSQKDLGGGWLLITHSNNPMKKAFLDKISKELNLGLIVKVENE